MKIHILGKDNNTIAYKLDTIYEKYMCTFTIHIIQNISTDETPPYHLEKVQRFKFNVINDYDWDGKYDKLIIGVNGPVTTKTVYNSFLKSHNITEGDYFTLFHPSLVISKQNDMGTGVFIGPGSIIAPYVTIGNLTTINRKVSIGHHVNIGKFVNLNPGCNIAGSCKIGDYSTIGMGANIIDRSSIGKNTIIGAGSLVTRSIPDNVIAYGVPARVIRKNN